MPMTFRRAWDFNHGNRLVSLNDLRDDDDTSTVLGQELADPTSPFGAALVAILDALPDPPPAILPAINHGNQAGALAISCDSYGLHEITLTGNLVVTPTGIAGSVAELRAYGAGTLTLAGVTWEGRQPVVPCSVLLRRFASGWRGVAVQYPTQVVPLAPTFNDSGNVLTIPAVTGVQYKKNGVNIAAGVYNGQPAGLMTITAVETDPDDYIIVTGSTVEWTHTFPALPVWSNFLEDTFTGANGSLTGHVPNVTPNGNAWVTGPPWAPGTLDPFFIATNKVNKDAANTNDSYSHVIVPNPAGAGIGAGIDYVLANETSDNQAPFFKLNYGPSIKLDKVDVGSTTATLSADNPSVGAMVLTGTLTGHPLTGRLSYRCQGTALTIYIDGVEVATGTMAQSWNSATEALIQGHKFQDSTLDNLTLEEYS